MKFSVYQQSRRGMREKNEDRMGYCYTRDSGLFALADGMGGHPEGEVASQMALQTLSAMFQREARPTLKEPGRFLHDAVMAAHHQLLRYATERALIDTPRTTLVACILQGTQAWWAHCGDSRLYLVRDDRLVARTRDHSYTELQKALTHGSGNVVKDPRISRSMLFTCLGSPGKPVVDTAGPIVLQAGDRLLLCSDGVWATVTDPEITMLMAREPVSHAVPNLVELALQRGGPTCDNVTALSIEWEGTPELPAAHGVSTDDLGEDVFASTIQASLGAEGLPEELDDDEIERAIREINDAIRRSAEKPSAPKPKGRS